MIFYFPYENFKRDSLSRLYLASSLLKKNKDNIQIEIGWYKDLFENIFKNLKKDFHKKKIIIDCNNFVYKYPLIKLLKRFNFYYFIIDEEEIGLTYFNKQKYISNRHLDRKMSYYVDGKFFLSKKIYENENNNNPKNYKKNLYLTSHPRIEFIKNYKNFFHEKENNFILICLPDSYFRYVQSMSVIRQGYNFINKPLKNYEIIKNRKIIVSNFLKMIVEIVKKNPREIFILRPHPSDTEFKHIYKKIFLKFKNLKVVFDYSSLFYINKSKLVICGLDFCAVETNLLGKQGIIFHKNLNNTFYKNHFSLGLSNFRYTDTKSKFNKAILKILKNKNKNKNKDPDRKITNLLLLNKNSIEEIKDVIFKKTNSKFKNSLTFIDKVCLFSLRNIFGYLFYVKSKNYKKVSEADYFNYLKKFKYSINNIILRKLVEKNLIYSLYKTLCFNNFHEHSAYRMSGQEQKIDKKYFHYLKKIFFKLNKKNRLKLSKNNLWIKIF